MTLSVTAGTAELAIAAPQVAAEPRERPALSLVGKAAATIWFVLLAIFYARLFGIALSRAFHDVHAPLAWASVITIGCTGLFYSSLGYLMLARHTPRARQAGSIPTLVAMTGTYGVWLVLFLPQVETGPLRAAAGAALTVIGSMFIILSIGHLGKSFSISPQARKLVTTGPYRFVRNPLYLAEEIAVAGVLLQFVWWWALAFFIAHAAIQVTRIRYEEAILRRTFPEYDSYAARTARLIPGVW